MAGPTSDGSGQRFEQILDALAESVTIRDPDDRIVYANRAALEQLGFDSVQALRDADPRAIMSEFEVTDEFGQPLGMEQVPSVRIFRGETPGPVLMKTVHRVTGEEKWMLLKAAPLHDADGNIEATATVIENVTAAKQAQLRADFLARASQILGSSLDHELTLRNVADLVVPEIADWCAVYLVDERGRRRQVVAAHADPQRRALAECLREHESERHDLDQPVGRVVTAQEPELHPDVTDEQLVAWSQSDEHLALLRELGMRSMLLVPMTVAGHAVGAISLVNSESSRRFGPEELEFATQLAARAAVAVENSRLFEQRATIAETLQRSLLPEALPEIDGWDIASLYRAAGGGTEVGGDFYDVFRAGGAWIVLIGDVTGKGVTAAAMTALVRYSARIIAEDQPDPAAILERLNDVLAKREPLSICSALCLRIDGPKVTLSSAGHPLPLHHGGSTVTPLGLPAHLLGMVTGGTRVNHEAILGTGDSLLLYTDGVTDTVGAAGRFGDARLQAVFEVAADRSSAEILAALDESLNEFQVGSQADDTAALALKRTSL